MSLAHSDAIPSALARTLPGLFLERVSRSHGAISYRQYDRKTGQWTDQTWAQTASQVARWQAAMLRENLEPGDRVAIMLRNCREWICFDLAALGLGLVTVPLYTDDRPENVGYILEDSGAKLLLLEGEEHWLRLAGACSACEALQRVVVLEKEGSASADARVRAAQQWLPNDGERMQCREARPDRLATIVYTSGTTGQPKGVMLSHTNILTNAENGLKHVPVLPQDIFLSFLPLSHTFERTVGYYLVMMAGATVVFARSIADLGEDLQVVRPTILISVPRIFERVYSKVSAGLQRKSPLARKLFEWTVEVGWSRFEYRQGRGSWNASHLLWPILDALVARKVISRLGGRLRFTICGGAALSPAIARTFIGLGLPVLQGYGLTESGPCISVNRIDDNVPASIGTPLASVETRIGERDELLARGPNIMLGYWNKPNATAQTIDSDGWLHTGDQARTDETGHLYITGRLKEIIVMSNGEKASPADMEMAIVQDPLFDQVMVIGEARPFLCALTVLNQEQWTALAQSSDLDTEDLHSREVEHLLLPRLSRHLHDFPGYAQIRRASFTLEPWTVENGLLTPTMKLKRARVIEHHAADVARIYEGH